MNNIKSRRIHPYTGLKSAGFFVFSEVVKYTIRGRFVYTPKNKNKGIKWSAAIWKQRYDALYNAYQELKKEVQPYLDAVKLAPEKVQAFFDAILTRTRQAKQPTKLSRRKQDMER